MTQDSTKRFSLFVMLGDAVVLYGAFLLAYMTRIQLQVSWLHPIHSLHEYTPAAWFTIALCLMVFVFYGLYDMRRKLSMVEEYVNIMKAISFSLVLALTMTFFFRYYERSRSLVVIFWMVSIFFMLVYRWLISKVIKDRRKRGWDNRNVVILGIDEKRRAVEKILGNFPELGMRCIENLLLNPERDLRITKSEYAITASLAEKIAKVMVKKRVDGLILTLPIKYYEQMICIVEWCEEKGMDVHYITSVVDILNSKAIQDELQESMFLENSQSARNFWKDFAKRLMDELISIPVLLFAMPIWLMVAIAIKLDSPGPVLFKQVRVGYMGRHFTIYKFRTMYVTAPKYGTTPRQKKDSRITRVGAWLRQTSIDELPQIWNVIKGDMSLVGPRPEQPFIVGKYNRAIYHRRHLVLPGLTGFWQVSGRSDKPLEENIKYDLYYIKHRSLLFDLIILLRTIPAVLSKKGAY